MKQGPNNAPAVLSVSYTEAEYVAHMDERKTLIEAARESSKTFDQAVLAFGSAVFGASIAFLKDVAPHPRLFTLRWLGASWFLFSLGLLAALFSFIFSHKACMAEVDASHASLLDRTAIRLENRWSRATDRLNYLCIGMLFFGMMFWVIFALENVAYGGSAMNQPQSPTDKLERGYVPPKAPPPPPPAQPPASPTPAPPVRK